MNIVIYDLLFGLVVVDVFGVFVEFKYWSELVEDFVMGVCVFGIYNQFVGIWLDDSFFIFCLVDSFCSGYDLVDIVRKFVVWWNVEIWMLYGLVFDIGMIIYCFIGVLDEILKSDDYDFLWFFYYEVDEYINGNGLFMCILLFYFVIKDKVFDE